MIGEHIEHNEDGLITISPSSIGMWFTDSGAWFKQQVLKERTFNGNTSTYIGTICHYKADCVIKGIDFNHKEVEEYIKAAAFNPEVDTVKVRSEYEEMSDLIGEYLTQHPSSKSEIFMSVPVSDFVKVAGTADRFIGNTISDYKTCKSFPTEMKPEHFYQIMLYAWLRIRTDNIKSDKAEVIHIKRPNSKSGADLRVLTREITNEDYLHISEVIEQITGAIHLYKENPKLKDFIFRNNPCSFYGKD